MGQYGNQPDFATRAFTIYPTGDPYAMSESIAFEPAALYVGTGGNLVVEVVGGNNQQNTPQDDIDWKYTLFTNVPSGTFLPVIVRRVYSTLDGGSGTTAGNLVALY